MPAEGLFTTVRSEGGLLPSDLLARIVAGDTELGGLAPTDYGFAPSERLGEAISRLWNDAKTYWEAFKTDQKTLGSDETGVSETRDWILRLLREIGYGRPEYRAAAEEINGRRYPIQHRSGPVPLHVLSFQQDLDGAGVAATGQRRLSPHALLQEYLNASDASLYGIVTNGLRLRLLRDNASITRVAYVEFDLEATFENSVYADFVLLFLAVHRTRLPQEGDEPTECWLERWREKADTQGTRALGALRFGVERAIEELGRGLLAHDRNEDLHQSLSSGQLSVADFYRELLRLVYRVILLLVAEDRGLLHPSSASPHLRAIYRRDYSASHLRDIARRYRTDDRHDDLWRTLRITFDLLSGRRSGLGLEPLGGLFSDTSCPHLDASLVGNDALAKAIVFLSYVRVDRRTRRVNYRDIGAEELGSVYESLLELHPALDVTIGRFDLAAVAGHERKATGSYYTPTSVTQRLLGLVLEPAIERAAAQPEPEAALLRLKVCDPACGSGHFLIAAAHRIAKRLARVRAGSSEPSLEATRTALRDVIARCIYGVDRNPMAVELCKVSLWMEALEPGRPLSFLDQRIQCGNSLLGATPRLLAQGIPSEAFQPLEGDDKSFVSSLRAQNQLERSGQQSLFAAFATDMCADQRQFAEVVAALQELPEESVEQVRAKEQRYRAFATSEEYQQSTLLANAWCAAFVSEKQSEGSEPVTEQMFQHLATNAARVPTATIVSIAKLTSQYRFFHWHLAFPEVFLLPDPDVVPENPHTGWQGGFDVVLGNPPWDAMSPDAKEFFSFYDPQVRSQDPDGQKQLIQGLLTDHVIADRWATHRREMYASVHFIKNSGRFRLFAPGNLGKGDFNVFRMFVETALDNTRAAGWTGQVTPEGLYNGANSMAIREMLLEHFSLIALLGFENVRGVWFKGVHGSAKFCIYAARKEGRTDTFRAMFNIRTVRQLAEATDGAALEIPVRLVREFSSDALALMEFSDQREINIAEKMYSQWPKLGEDPSDPLYRLYMREIDMGNDRDLFDGDPSGVPVYEGRMVWHFDHRAKGYGSGRGRSADWLDLSFHDGCKGIAPQWFISRVKVPTKVRERTQRYRIGLCNVGSPTNERTLVAALIPPATVCGHSLTTITFADGYDWGYLSWLAVANSFAMDYLSRKKVSLNITHTIMDSLPFPRLDVGDSRLKRIARLVLLLSCTGAEMIPFWNAMAKFGWVEPVALAGPSPGLVDEMERLNARAGLDAIVARDLFGLTTDEMSYILDAFPTARKYELAKYGSFRSRELILERMVETPVEALRDAVA